MGQQSYRTSGDNADFRLSIQTQRTDNQGRSAFLRLEKRFARANERATIMDRIVDSYVTSSATCTRGERKRERERLPPGTIVESWESSDYIRPINFFAGTDPGTVSHGVPEPRGEKKEAAPVLFFMRARLTRLYHGMRPVMQLQPADRACYVSRRFRND